MSISITKPFTVILSGRDHRHLGEIINISGMQFTDYLNHAKEICFSVAKTADGRNEKLWEDIADLKLIYVKEINTYFEINVALNEANYNEKIVTGKSACECELSQKILYDMEINTEADIERTDYEPTVFYNAENPRASLLNRIFSEYPAYTIKYVAPSLMRLQRSFSINDKSIYDFLTGECADEFDCIFLFDSVDRAISVYDLCAVCMDCGYRGHFTDTCPECGGQKINYFGDDTSILVTTDNLTDEIQLETNVDNIKNCFKLEAGDDIMTAAIMSYIPSGGRQMFYIPEQQLKDMPPELAEKIRSYNTLYDSQTDNYSNIIRHIYECIEQITYYTSKQMPDITVSGTTASTEAAKLTPASLNPLSLSSLTSYTSLATVNSALVNYARVYIRSGFVKLEIDSGSFQYNGKANGVNTGTWTGRFKVTNYSDKEDISYSANLTITVNDDYQSFMREKILKNIAGNNSDDNQVSDVLNIKNKNTFSEALTQYSLNRLISFRDAINSVLSVLQEAGGGNVDSELYIPFYTKYYDKLSACNAEIQKRRKTIEEWQSRQKHYEEQKEAIQKALDLKRYLGESLYNLFTTYIREDKYVNSNYISDGLSDDEIFKRAQEFIDRARRELIKSSYYQHSIHTNLYNLLLLEEFAPIVDHFKLGNWIRVMTDDEIYRLRLISYKIDFDNLHNIDTDFSDLTVTANGMNDIHDILSQANSMASTYAYVSKQASKGQDADMTIEQMRSEGLNSALYTIKNADTEEITFGKNGIWARSYDDISDSYSDEQLIITHNILAYTIDNLRSVKCALGKMKLTIDGKTTYEYGLNSDFCISSKIIAGNIYSADYSSANTRGTRLNLDDGTFTLADGKIVFDGNKLKIRDVEIDWSTTNESESMWTSINANANAISLEITRAVDSEKLLSSEILQTAEQLQLKIKDAEDGLSTQINQTANQIVLKADADGNMVQVALGADPKTGTQFKVNADNICLTANDVMDIIAGTALNFTTKKLSIVSDNFTLDSHGNVRLNNLEAVSFSGKAIEDLNSAIFDSETMRRIREIIDIFDARMNDVETLLTNNKVIFDLLDEKSYYWNGGGIGDIKLTPTGFNNIIDCTGYKKCIVRVQGSISSTPSGSSNDHSWISLTFSNDPRTNNPETGVVSVVHKFQGEHIGSGQDGVAYNSWYNAELDISALTGEHALNAFAWGSYQNAGHLWVSKIMLTNQ